MPATPARHALPHPASRNAAPQSTAARSRRCGLLAAAIVTGILLSGCGQRGPLYLPQPQAGAGSPAQGEPAQPETGKDKK